MNPATRRTLLLATVVLVLGSLFFRRGSYAIERLALELRYFWWLVLIVVGGIWLIAIVGRGNK